MLRLSEEELVSLDLLPEGDGEETLTDQVVSPAQPSTGPGSFPLREADGFSPEATALPVTSADKDGAATHPSFSSPRAVELDESIPPDPNATTTEGTGLQTSAPAVSADATTGLRNKNLSALPPPAANTTNQPGQNGTEPSSPTGPTGAATMAPTPPPPKDTLATTGSSPLEPSAFSTLGPTTGNPEPTPENPEPTPQTAQENATEESTAGPTTVPAAMTTGSPPATTTPSTTTVTPGASSTNRAATTAVMQPSANPVHEEASVLDVGDDDGQDLPSSAVAGAMGPDPLVIGVISMFVIMVGILALVGFLRYRQRNSRMEFRRLQDLPMDDMMEDTPLSLYSY
ncbi:leucine-rich repeat extensin-like protein 5 isoform X2 [Dermochelys coriacea]|uniref:leucine-rich repeat extensin-like protein 5 isoform X2 n=1 Tax=Dermochelys coriacea TaxID=27794 RepID=UPI0018E6DD35|nr:leucine-rich repeat extensin-like protein 5 isoform X2 [Dermochelys coriacea]